MLLYIHRQRGRISANITTLSLSKYTIHQARGLLLRSTFFYLSLFFLHQLFSNHGVPHVHVRLWGSDDPVAVYVADVKLFSTWFRSPVSQTPRRGVARLYRRFHRRVKLCREDKTSAQTTACSALNDGWTQCTRNERSRW